MFGSSQLTMPVGCKTAGGKLAGGERRRSGRTNSAQSSGGPGTPSSMVAQPDGTTTGGGGSGTPRGEYQIQSHQTHQLQQQQQGQQIQQYSGGWNNGSTPPLPGSARSSPQPMHLQVSSPTPSPSAPLPLPLPVPLPLPPPAYPSMHGRSASQPSLAGLPDQKKAHLLPACHTHHAHTPPQPLHRLAHPASVGSFLIAGYISGGSQANSQPSSLPASLGNSKANSAEVSQATTPLASPAVQSVGAYSQRFSLDRSILTTGADRSLQPPSIHYTASGRVVPLATTAQFGASGSSSDSSMPLPPPLPPFPQTVVFVEPIIL